MHFGKPKFWYGITPQEGEDLENIARKYMPDAFNKCSENMRHKTTLINPYLLKKISPELNIVK